MLTIAIPSLNRSTVLLQTLEQLHALDSVQVLIVNDGSTTGNYKDVEEFISGRANFRIVHYQENFGCSTALMRVFENCRTEFLMLLSDEDVTIPSTVELLIEELRKDEFGYVVLRDAGKNKIKKSAINVRAIKSQSAYFSSNVFKVSSAMEPLAFIRNLAKDEEFAHLYPHTLLAITVIAQGKKSLKISAQGHTNRVFESTEIRTLSGGHAHQPTERVMEHLSFLRCLDKMTKIPGVNPKTLNKARKSAQSKFFGSILDSVSTIDLQARDDMIKSVPRTYLAWWPKKLIKNLKRI